MDDQNRFHRKIKKNIQNTDSMLIDNDINLNNDINRMSSLQQLNKSQNVKQEKKINIYELK